MITSPGNGNLIMYVTLEVGSYVDLVIRAFFLSAGASEDRQKL